MVQPPPGHNSFAQSANKLLNNSSLTFILGQALIAVVEFYIMGVAFAQLRFMAFRQSDTLEW
jgi:hypothetical protein